MDIPDATIMAHTIELAREVTKGTKEAGNMGPFPESCRPEETGKAAPGEHPSSPEDIAAATEPTQRIAIATGARPDVSTSAATVEAEAKVAADRAESGEGTQ